MGLLASIFIRNKWRLECVLDFVAGAGCVCPSPPFRVYHHFVGSSEQDWCRELDRSPGVSLALSKFCTDDSWLLGMQVGDRH